MNNTTMSTDTQTDLYAGGIVTGDHETRYPCPCCGLENEILHEGDICASCGWEHDLESEKEVWSSFARNQGANRMDFGGYRLGLWDWLLDRNKMFGRTICPLNFIDPLGRKGHDALEKRLSKIIPGQGKRPEKDFKVPWDEIIKSLVVGNEIEIDIYAADEKGRLIYGFTAYPRSDCQDSWQELLSGQSQYYSKDEVECGIGIDIINLDLKELVHPEYMLKVLVALLLGAADNAVSKRMVAVVFTEVEDKLEKHIEDMCSNWDMDSSGDMMSAFEALHRWVDSCIDGEEWMQYKY